MAEGSGFGAHDEVFRARLARHNVYLRFMVVSGIGQHAQVSGPRWGSATVQASGLSYTEDSWRYLQLSLRHILSWCFISIAILTLLVATLRMTRSASTVQQRFVCRTDLVLETSDFMSKHRACWLRTS